MLDVKNVLGGEWESCCGASMMGFYRNGKFNTGLKSDSTKKISRTKLVGAVTITFTNRCDQDQWDMGYALVPSSLKAGDNAKLEKIIHQEYPLFS